jgi:hypothetical protein
MISSARLVFSQPPCECGSVMGAPDAHRFVAHRHTSLSKQVLDITQTQGEAMVREHRVCDDFEGKQWR